MNSGVKPHVLNVYNTVCMGPKAGIGELSAFLGVGGVAARAGYRTLTLDFSGSTLKAQQPRIMHQSLSGLQPQSNIYDPYLFCTHG